MSEKNKVRFGLRNAHYAIITIVDGAITYGTPVPIPGAVNLILNPVGDKTEFYADDYEYFGTTPNQGYDGSLEVALIPDNFRKDVYKYKEDKNGVLFEDANAISENIAILYQFAGDKKATRYVDYYCNVGRPNVEASTKTKGIEPKTETIPLTTIPRPSDGFTRAKIEQGQEGYDDFFKNVYEFIEETTPPGEG